MKKKVLMAALIAVCTFATCFITSCTKEDPDGAWDPMKWKTSVTKNKDGWITVPSEGGTYVFVCTNYNAPWMSDICERIDGKNVYYDRENLNLVKGTWITAQMDGTTMTVTVDPNTTGKEREASVTATAGDIFDTFSFRQEANQ